MQANMLQAYRDVVWNLVVWERIHTVLVLFTCICHYYISSMCCSQIHPCVFADRSMSQSTAKNVWHFCLGFDQDGIPARWRWLTLDFLCNLGASLLDPWPCRDICFWLKVSENVRQRWCSNDLYWMCLKKKGVFSIKSPIDIHFLGHPRSLKISGPSQGVLGGFRWSNLTFAYFSVDLEGVF